MENINRASRKKSVTLISKDEPAASISGDFKPEGGIFDHFQKADILIPTEVDAIKIEYGKETLYAIQFYIGVNPKGDVDVNELEVNTQFTTPVSRLKAWDPTDKFVVGKTVSSSTSLKAEFSSDQLVKLNNLIPGFAENLLPQFAVSHETISKNQREELDDLVRTITDGQRKLVFKLSKNTETKVDPKQFIGKIVFATKEAPKEQKLDCLDLEINCRCGVFSLKSNVQQKVAVFF
jgi:hypothetical protein